MSHPDGQSLQNHSCTLIAFHESVRQYRQIHHLCFIVRSQKQKRNESRKTLFDCLITAKLYKWNCICSEIELPSRLWNHAFCAWHMHLKMCCASFQVISFDGRFSTCHRIAVTDFQTISRIASFLGANEHFLWFTQSANLRHMTEKYMNVQFYRSEICFYRIFISWKFVIYRCLHE